jgi:hypothetical protein
VKDVTMPWDNQAIAEANGIAPETPLDEPQTPQAETYDPAEHGRPEDQRPAQQYQPQQRHDPGIPDVEEDPIAHFDTRQSRLEQHATLRDWEHAIKEADRHGREELPDFDDAVEHLLGSRVQELNAAYPDNSQHAHAQARHMGFPSPAHMKQAMLQNSIMATVAAAAQQGIPTSMMAYRMATERGYRPKAAATRTQKRQLSAALERAHQRGSDKDFDAGWNHYARIARAEDELARGRR